jgi:hypothetical protein
VYLWKSSKGIKYSWDKQNRNYNKSERSINKITGYRLDDRRSIQGNVIGIFLCHCIQTDSEAHLAYLELALAPSSTKRPEHEADYSSEPIAEIKNSWAISSHPLYILAHLIYLEFMRFEVFTVVNVKIAIFSDVTPCILVHRYQGIKGSRFISYLGICVPNYTRSHPLLLLAQTIYHRLIGWLVNNELIDVEGKGRDLRWGTMSVFFWRRLRKIAEDLRIPESRFQPGSSRATKQHCYPFHRDIRSYILTPWCLSAGRTLPFTQNLCIAVKAWAIQLRKEQNVTLTVFMDTLSEVHLLCNIE